jgi:hypothetical protein
MGKDMYKILAETTGGKGPLSCARKPKQIFYKIWCEDVEQSHVAEDRD